MPQHGSTVGAAGSHTRILSPTDRMWRKLRTKQGRQRYALRMETVEPVVGQIKQARGFRQFLLQGLEKVDREWPIICTGPNLLKLFRFRGKASAKSRVKQLIRCVENAAGIVGTMVVWKLSGRRHL